jgi:hypothetical protein
MYSPTSHPWPADESLGRHLEARGVSRREFLEFCGGLCTVLGLGSSFVPRVAQALQAVRRPSVIWLQLQECTGCVESVIRTSEPTIGNLVLDLVSLDYQHTLMAAAGHQAEAALQTAMKENAGCGWLHLDPPAQSQRRTRRQYVLYPSPKAPARYRSSRWMTATVSTARTNGRSSSGQTESTRTAPPTYASVRPRYIGFRVKRYGPVVTRRVAG